MAGVKMFGFYASTDGVVGGGIIQSFNHCVMYV